MKNVSFIKLLPVMVVCLFAALYGVVVSSDSVFATTYSTVDSKGIGQGANTASVETAVSPDSDTVDAILINKRNGAVTTEKKNYVGKAYRQTSSSSAVITSVNRSDFSGAGKDTAHLRKLKSGYMPETSPEKSVEPVGKPEKPVVKSVAGDSGKSSDHDMINHTGSVFYHENRMTPNGRGNAFLKKTETVFRKIASFNPLKRKKHPMLENSNEKIFTPDRTATEKPQVKKNLNDTAGKLPDTLLRSTDTSIVNKTSPVRNIKKVLSGMPSTDAIEKKTEWRFFKAGKVLTALIVFFAGWLVLHYVTLLMNLLSERWPQYRLLIKGFIPVVRIVGWTVLLSFIVIGVFKPPIQSVLAFTASAGIAIGFASQDILKNIFGGIVILFDKPFKVGDKIQIDSFYGEVISIGIRTVRIVTMDDSVVAVPNSEIVSKSVSNANSGEPDCQVAAEFYFEPDMNLDKAYSLAQQCAAISRYIYLNKPIAVVFKNEMYLGRNMIHMRLKAYVIDHRFEMPFITDMSRTVYREFRRAGLIDTTEARLSAGGARYDSYIH